MAASMPKVVVPTRFEGFADREGRFFRSLARNQRRDWFEAHRDDYESGWLTPMKTLLSQVRDRIEGLFPLQPLAVKVFRIHRDVRFSKDKSPYKTHIGGYVATQGDRSGPSATAVLYFHIGTGELFVASGQYMMDGPRLARFRAALLDDRSGRPLDAILAKLKRAGFAVGSHDVLQRVPRGVDPDHPRADLLKRKGLIVTFPEPPRALLVQSGLVDWLVRHTKRAAPLVDWLEALAD
jgi:uncharacterized protein (TIGR02453 family)